MERLQIETKDRPVPVTAKQQQPSAAGSSAMAVVDFDPYKTSIVRTAPQPSRGGGVSQTEAQLEHLNKRRRELEGSIEAVSRETRVLLPRLDGTVASLQDFLDNGAGSKDEGGQQSSASNSSSSSSSSSRGGNPTNEVSDNTILARSIAAQMKAGGGSSSGGGLDEPMTTKAVRDLRKALTERVYGKTLVRVKFPDRCCVQAYFHPRNTINDVYRWLRETCLKEELVKAAASSSSSSSVDRLTGGKSKVPYGLQGAPIASSSSLSSSVTLTVVDYLSDLFELYTTPPRCVLHPYAKSQQQQDNGSSTVFQPQNQPQQYASLLELKFVPAVMLHCSWSPPLAAEIKTTTEGTATAPPMSPGEAYLRTELWQQAMASSSSTAATIDEVSFPAGASLALDDRSSSSNATDNSNNNDNSNGDGKDGGGGQTSSKPKPKWLKI